jgi:hypothetical protein
VQRWSIIKPTTLYALLKFKKYSQSTALILTFDLANPNYPRRQVLNGVKRAIFQLKYSTCINFGILLGVYRDIREPLHVNRGR